MDKGLLIYLITDLLRSPEVRTRFYENPEAVMEDYELEEEQRAVLYTMDASVIGAFILDEFMRVAPLAKGASIRPDWPFPHPHIREVAFRGALRAVANEPLVLEIEGEGFLRESSIWLAPAGGSPDVRVPGTIIELSGSFREMKLRASFDLQAATPGSYRLFIQNGQRGRLLDFDQAIEIG